MVFGVIWQILPKEAAACAGMRPFSVSPHETFRILYHQPALEAIIDAGFPALFQVFDSIRNVSRIAGLMSTIREVAKAAGVSIATVSAALNESASVSEETRRRVLAAAEAVGYAPNAIAQSLRRGNSRLIGVVIGDISNPFCSTMIRTFDRHAIAAGYSMIVCNSDDDEHRELLMLDQLRSQRVAGIILLPVGTSAGYRRHLENRILQPLVTVDQKIDGLARDFVGVDNRAAARLLTEYLIRLGHRRIAMICGRPGIWTSEERLAAFREAMAEAGHDVDPSLCVPANYDGRLAYQAVIPMMSRADRPTAIIGANNVMALSALQAVIDLGFRCPADVSIAGIDDVPWGGLVRPRVTSAVQPVEEIAAVAFSWLMERMAARSEPGRAEPNPRTKTFAPRMVFGGSCAPLRNAAEAVDDRRTAISEARVST
jgi:LacI family transcriptional regulator